MSVGHPTFPAPGQGAQEAIKRTIKLEGAFDSENRREEIDSLSKQLDALESSELRDHPLVKSAIAAIRGYQMLLDDTILPDDKKKHYIWAREKKA